MLGRETNKKTVLTEYDFNVVELREEGMADEEHELNSNELAQEQAQRHPFAMMLGGLFTAWLGYHWMSKFTAYVKTGAMGAGGVLLFVVYPMLAAVVLAGLGMFLGGLRALFSSR